MKIKNWDRWQTYRKDRGTPPWIKVHRNLFSNPEWAELTDAEKGQLVSIWVLAADKSGEIPGSSVAIQKMCALDAKPNLSKFIDLGFLESDCQPHGNQLVTTCPQLDAPETETETETEAEGCDANNASQGKRKRVPYEDILKIYHEKLPNNPHVASLSANRKSQIKARWLNGLPDLKAWGDYFIYTSESMFLTGRSPPSQGRKVFFANIDFLIKENNMLKIVEGFYHEERN